MCEDHDVMNGHLHTHGESTLCVLLQCLVLIY